MTDAYSMASMPQNNYGYGMYEKQQRQSGGPSVFGAASLGFAGGAVTGYLVNKNPIKKDGTVTDTFVQKAFENYVKKAQTKEDKIILNQMDDCLKNINKVKDSEGLKKLLAKNDKVSDLIHKGTMKDLFETSITKENLSSRKEAVKAAVQAQKDYNYSLMRDTIKTCWDPDKKKFVKPEKMGNDKVFKIIKNTKNSGVWKKSLKYGGIGAGILGVLTLAYKMVSARSQ